MKGDTIEVRDNLINGNQRSSGRKVSGNLIRGRILYPEKRSVRSDCISTL